MKNFSKALASEDSQEIINLIKNEEKLDTDLLNQLLKECDSPAKRELIKREFDKRLNSEEQNKSTGNIIKAPVEGETQERGENPQPQSITDNNEKDKEKYENLSEEQALKKYSFGNSKYDKALEMFTNGFKANLAEANFDKVVKLSKSIVEQIISEFSSSFPKEVRSKSHNLKENSKLCNDVYDGRIHCADFVKMTAEQMQSEDLKSKDSEYIKNGILASQLAKSAAETDIFKCSKCKQNKCTYTQLQTRSCDEPMTTFVTCTICGHVWKF